MATRYCCDGCDDMLAQGVEPKRLGVVLPRDYCPACAEIAAAYLNLVNELHTDIASEWQHRLAAIRAKFANLPLLPDTNTTKPKGE